MALTSRRLGAGLAGVALLAAVLVGACAEKKGGLILAINTDMKAPKDVNAVSVTISTNGAIKHSFIGRVTPQGDVLLPATLAIVQPDDASAPIRIRVIAFQERKPRVLRDVRTTVPRDGRTALLRIPLNFVNDGSTKSAPLPDGVLPPLSTGGSPGSPAGADFDFFGSFQPECPDIENQTFIDGECKDNFVDPAVLPEYEDALVFGSGSAGDTSGCFEVASCFQGATQISEGGGADVPPPTQGDGGAGERTFTPQAISLDRGTCTISLNGAEASQLNLAIVTPDTGECVKEGECYIPIDQGPTGWRLENGSVQLPRVVCTLLGKGLRLFQTSGKCSAKTESQPICRPKPPTFKCSNQEFDSCGKCLETNCNAQASKCFGPDWVKGNFGGVCRSFLQCYCECTDPSGECKQCEGTQQVEECNQCLEANVSSCLEQNNCPCGGKNSQDKDGGSSEVPTASVHLTFTPGTPPPQPSPGTSFDATMGQFSNPVPGNSSVQANSVDPLQAFIKVEWCTGSFTAGKTFTQFSRGPGCINGNPVVEFATTTGAGHWVSGMDLEQPGSLKIESLNPLHLIFQGVKLDAQNGQTTSGSFTINGGAQWFNATGP